MIDFSSSNFNNSECSYDVDVTITFTLAQLQDSYTAEANKYLFPSLSLFLLSPLICFFSSTVIFHEGSSTPLIQFDASSSTCGRIENGRGLYFSVIGVPDDGSVSLEWSQVEGTAIGACPEGFDFLLLIFFSSSFSNQFLTELTAEGTVNLSCITPWNF